MSHWRYLGFIADGERVVRLRNRLRGPMQHLVKNADREIETFGGKQERYVAKNAKQEKKPAQMTLFQLVYAHSHQIVDCYGADHDKHKPRSVPGVKDEAGNEKHIIPCRHGKQKVQKQDSREKEEHELKA
jgi:hypothetical protein